MTRGARSRAVVLVAIACGLGAAASALGMVACVLGREPAAGVGSAPVGARSADVATPSQEPPRALELAPTAAGAPMPTGASSAPVVGLAPAPAPAPAPVSPSSRPRSGARVGTASPGPARPGLAHSGIGPGRPMDRQAVAIARLLTASMVPDADDREAYLGFLGRQTSLAEAVPLDTSRRLRVQVVDQAGHPVNDAHVRVSDGARAVEARTHADGVWDFFPGLGALAQSAHARIEVSAGSAQAMREVALPTSGDADTVRLALSGFTASAPRKLELVFLVDATGSMEDELRYVNDEVVGIVERVRASVDNVDVRVGATFYRDREDTAPIERIAMTTNVGSFAEHMHAIRADGGGDYAEDMSKGLASVLEQQRWASDAVRVLVLIADAPPQHYGADFDFVDAARVASAEGVRILSVSASGSDREVEYLFRALGTITSTPFAQLTDDSGIGGAHLAADAPAQRTEMFSDLLTRLLVSDLRGQGMHASGWQGPRS